MKFECKLDRKSKEHLYIQLYKELKYSIVSGFFTANSKLPPIRSLAKQLSVNNVTVVNAYNLLENDGLVYKISGSGTFVTPIDDDNIEKKSTSIDFSVTSLESTLFPIENFKIAINKVLDRDLGKVFEYQEIKGFKPLRESLVKYLKSTNIDVALEDIHIISGAQQGIDIISKGLVDYNDVIFIEDPTYAGAVASFKMKGADIVRIPISFDGINMEQLESLLQEVEPKFFYTIPNFHNPTGYTYSYKNKLKLLELAQQYNFYIIEDDYSNELNFSDSDIVTIKSLDKYDRVIYIKSFSKVLMPGLRLGFIIAPKIMEKELLYAKHISDISTSGLLQRAFDIFLRSGYLEQQLKIILSEYKKRFDFTIKLIENKYKDSFDINLPKGGLNFWFKLPENIDVVNFYEELLNSGVKVAIGEDFSENSKYRKYFRLNIASVSISDIELGIKIIDDLIKLKLKNDNYNIPMI